jgi:hypothetical protein
MEWFAGAFVASLTIAFHVSQYRPQEKATLHVREADALGPLCS